VAKLDGMKQLAGIACSLVALSLAPVASADEDRPAPVVTEDPTALADTLHLKSSGIVRGRVTELVGGDHVTIVTPTGETRHVPWSDVEHLILVTNKFPKRRASRPPPQAAPAPEPAPMVGRRARVHIVASGGSTYLYRQAAGTTDYVTACEAPCDLELPLGDSYKIGGNGLTTTPAFQLQERADGTVLLDVRGANWLGIVGGWTLIGVGGTVAYAGLLLAGASDDHDDNGGTALGCIGVGGAALALGIVMYLNSSTTDVMQPKLGSSKDAFVRRPVWRSASSEQGRAAPATFPVLFEQRF
jgi:hypothetical protein